MTALLTPALEQLLHVKEWSLYNFKFVERKNEHWVSAQMSPHTWQVEVIVDPDLPNKIQKITKDPKDLEDLLYASVEHELGHWEHCPFDIDYHEEIMAGVAEGLAAAGIAKEKIPGLSQTAANLFSDIIVNVSNCLGGPEPSRTQNGIGVFYWKEGALAGKYSPGYAAFVEIQARLAFPQKFQGLARVYSADYSLTDQLAKECITVLAQKKKSSAGILRELHKRDKWHDKSKEIARILAPYLEAMPEELPDKGSEGGGGSKRELIKRSIAKGRGMNDGLAYATPFEVMDELYKQRASKVLIQLPPTHEKSKEFVIAHCQRNEWQGNGIEQVDWPSTLVVGKKLAFHEKHTPLAYQSPLQPSQTSLRDLCFLVDSSGSMYWFPDKGEGPYDLLLRTVYSVFNYLEDIGKASVLRYGAINFSNQSIWSGWKTKNELEEVKKVLFAHQCGGTTLEPSAIASMYTTAKDKFHAVMITDGAISNADSVLKEVQAVLQQGNSFTLVQIGAQTSFCTAVAGLGGDTHIIASPKELPGLVLGDVRARYGRS